jgi:hypothetical protein
VVRALQLVAVVALDERRGADREMRTAFTLARLGNLPLGDAHANNSLTMTRLGDAAV